MQPQQKKPLSLFAEWHLSYIQGVWLKFKLSVDFWP